MPWLTNQISDSTILTLIRENDPRGWNQLYDKYAALMYGIICTHTTDIRLAEEIFIQLFIGLKQEEILLKTDGALCVCILRYTQSNTRQELKRRGINYTQTPMMGNSVLDILCCEYATIKEVAAKLNISQKEVQQNLRKELLIIRSKNQDTQPIQKQ